MAKERSRNRKQEEYTRKYSGIPIDYKERLEWLCNTLNITEKMNESILNKRLMMLHSFQYYDLEIVLFEVPEGSPRPRFRLINRSNLGNMALSNPNFVHVYSLTGKEDSVFMRRLIDQQDFIEVDQLICTPCIVEMNAYVQTPSYYSKEDVILAEIGLERPLSKPDWDNIEKKYSDMFNKNVWLDDTFVVDGSIHKFYSVLPRIEIKIRYLNMLYNKYQYNQVTNRVDYSPETQINYFNEKDVIKDVYK